MWADQDGGRMKKTGRQAAAGKKRVSPRSYFVSNTVSSTVSNTVRCTVLAHCLARYLRARRGQHTLPIATPPDSASNSAVSTEVERRRANRRGNSYATQTAGQGSFSECYILISERVAREAKLSFWGTRQRQARPTDEVVS